MAISFIKYGNYGFFNYHSAAHNRLATPRFHPKMESWPLNDVK